VEASKKIALAEVVAAERIPCGRVASYQAAGRSRQAGRDDPSLS
jgi:hypothetical protein